MSAKLKAFLRKSPQPVAIEVDGKRVEVPKTGRPWIEVVSTIKALNGCKILALGSDGSVLRAFELADTGEATDVSGSSGSDEGSSDLQLFARLLADAHDKGGKNAEPLLRAAMDFVGHQRDQLTNLTRENEKLRSQNMRLQAEILRLTSLPQGEGEGEPDLLSAIMSGVMQAQQARTPALPATNGTPSRRDHSHAVKDPPGGKQPRKVES